MQISRRDALLGASAAVAVAGVPTAIAAQASDAALLAQIGRFPNLYGQWTHMWEKARAHRATVEAMPDCPGFPDYHARDAFLEAHDYFRYWPEANKLGEPMGAFVNAIFETPAETARGVLGKISILYIARGDYDGNGNDDLEGFQDDETCSWFGSVIADLERLAGEVPS